MHNTPAPHTTHDAVIRVGGYTWHPTPHRPTLNTARMMWFRAVVQRISIKYSHSPSFLFREIYSPAAIFRDTIRNFPLLSPIRKEFSERSKT